jgi:hypothetical protein
VKAVHALRQLMADGEFTRGESATTAHSQFAEKANRVIRWINDPDALVTREENTWNKGTILVQAFRQWEEHDSGDRNKHTGVQHINELLRQAGLRYAIRRGQRGYYGLQLDGPVFMKDRDKPYLNVTPALSPESAPNSTPPDDQMALELGG